MASLDLNSLTPEVIQKMGYTPQDLWMVKIENEVYGPFEVESLKHYASENEKLFAEAQASRLDLNDWQPFVEQAAFSAVADKIHHEEQVSHYWLLMKGQKSGPFTVQEMQKKIELELIAPSDQVSTDDGHSWKKFFTMGHFYVKGTVDDLPTMPPTEASFQMARDELDEKMENAEGEQISVSLAGLAYLGNSKDRLLINLEEIDLKSLQETEVSRSMKWAVPTAVASVAVIAFMGLNILSGPSMEEVAVVEDEVIQPKKVITHNAPPATPRPRMAARPSQEFRRPASTPRFERSELTQPRETFYPTHVETHHEPDPMIDPVTEAEPSPAPYEEPSLVSSNSQEGVDGMTLDQAMSEAISNEAMPQQQQPSEPVIEEATDF